MRWLKALKILRRAAWIALAVLALVAGLLERCDDAVYAHRYPDFASADHDLTVAYEIVELSRPRLRTASLTPEFIAIKERCLNLLTTYAQTVDEAA